MATKKSILWGAPKIIKESPRQTATKKNGWVRNAILKTGNYINNSLDKGAAKIRQKQDLDKKIWDKMEEEHGGPMAQSPENVTEWNYRRKKENKKR